MKAKVKFDIRLEWCRSLAGRGLWVLCRMMRSSCTTYYMWPKKIFSYRSICGGLTVVDCSCSQIPHPQVNNLLDKWELKHLFQTCLLPLVSRWHRGMEIGEVSSKCFISAFLSPSISSDSPSVHVAPKWSHTIRCIAGSPWAAAFFRPHPPAPYTPPQFYFSLMQFGIKWQ